MSQSTKNASGELLRSQNSTENKSTPNKPSPDYEHTFEKIPYTPFNVVGDNEKGYMAICGAYQLTDRMKTVNDVVEYVNSQPWELIITLMTMVIHTTKEIESKQSINKTV